MLNHFDTLIAMVAAGMCTAIMRGRAKSSATLDSSEARVFVLPSLVAPMRE